MSKSWDYPGPPAWRAQLKTFESLRTRKKSLDWIYAQRRRRHREKAAAYREFLKGDLESFHLSIVRLLRFRLERQRDYLLSHPMHSNPHAAARQINHVARLLKRVETRRYERDIPRRLSPADRRMVWKSNREFQRVYRAAHRLQVRDLRKALDLILKHLWNWWEYEFPNDGTPFLGFINVPIERGKK